MAKSIKNKQYNEFWEDDKLNIEKSDKKTDSNVSSEEIKKLEKKLTKKVTGLEKEIKELKEEPKVEEIQPVNKPRGWHAKNEFIDDIGNKFFKGKYVGKEEPKDEEQEYLERAKENMKKIDKEKYEKIAENIIPDFPEFKDVNPIPPVDEKVVVENMVKEPIISDERKMETPKEIPDLSKIEPIVFTEPKPIVRKILTDKDIYQQYINDRIPFKMFFRGNLIFDSKIQPVRNYPKFNDDGFILFGKNYIYRGIRIEKY